MKQYRLAALVLHTLIAGCANERADDGPLNSPS